MKKGRILAAILGSCLAVSMCVTSLADTKANAQTENPVQSDEEVKNPDSSMLLVPGAIPTELGLSVNIVNGIGSVDQINVQTINGADYLFLPSNADMSSLMFNFNPGLAVFIEKGDDLIQISTETPFDITPYVVKKGADGSRFVKLQAALPDGSFKEYGLTVMQSANIAAMYIKSDDAVKKGLHYVESVKGNKGSGKMDMVNADGSVVYSGELAQIKGRGNSTWAAFKKPFQIKLGTKMDLCQTGDSDNANKTWVLLANSFDPTLIRNMAAFDIASSMGIIAPDYRPLDLYYDGMYLGTYLLCEKVETGKGRVNIGDNGFLMEMDVAYYAQEDNYFVDVTGTPFVIKNPEECSNEQIKFVTDYFNAAMSCALAGGKNEETGVGVWDYIDMESLAKYYVFQQLVKNPDAFFSSSYFYLPTEGKLMAGPAWDFDSSFGVVVENNYKSTTGIINSAGWMSAFVNLPEFKEAVKGIQAKYASPAAMSENAKISAYANMLSSSRKMNDALWRGIDLKYYSLGTYEQNVVYLKNFLSGRNSYLNSHIGR